jgi:hypothetical protein
MAMGKTVLLLIMAAISAVEYVRLTPLVVAAEASQNALPSTATSTELKFPMPPADEWEEIPNEASYTRNYSRKQKRPYELYRHVITIYETPMSTDRREGKSIAPGEYLQIFKVGNGGDVVIQLRVDRGRYWILSRQRIRLDNHASLIARNPEQSESSFYQFRFELQDIIETTRHFLLNQM